MSIRLLANNRRWQLTLGAILIFVLALAAYWPALQGQFVWDDALLVEKNPLVKGQLGLHSVWFQTDFPLTMVAFWLEWLMWGKSPAGYHVVNVLLHASSAVLVWRVLSRLKVTGAWLAGVIFAVHPVGVCSVAWVSELKNVLSLPFFLLSVLWYLRFEDGAGSKGEGRGPGQEARHSTRHTRHFFYWLSLLAFVLALLSKTSTVMLPVVLLACAWWQRGRITRQDWLRAGPFLLLALVFGLLTVWFQTHQAIGNEIVQTEGFLGRLAGAGMAIWFYLGKALAPLNLNLIYPRRTIDAAAPLSYVPVLLFSGLLIACWRFRRSWGRPVFFGLSCFAVLLFPALGFFDMYFLAISRVSDHFQYLALIAIVALVAAVMSSALSRRFLPLAGAGLVLVLSSLTVQRAGIFAHDETLWRDTLAKNPAAWPAHNNMGCLLAEQQKYDEAIGHFLTSLQINPRNPPAHCNLGKALSLKNRFAEAETHFRAALAIKPQDAETQKAFGSTLAQEGKNEEALIHLRKAISLQPDVETRLNLAQLLYRMGRGREAVIEFRRVLALKPDLVEALNNAAWLLATCGDDSVRDGAEAVQLAEKACRLTLNKEAVPLGTLAAAYAETGNFSNAVATAGKSLAVATAAGEQRLAEINLELLKLYRAGKPWHEPRREKEAPGTKD